MIIVNNILFLESPRLKDVTDKIFNWCVDILVKFAKLLGLTYNEINVYIFVIITPLIFLIMFFIIITQQIKIKSLNKQNKILK